MKKKFIILLILFVIILIEIPIVLSVSSYVEPLQSLYGSGSCITCHTSSGGGSRNSYGTLFENQPNHDTDPVTALQTIGAPPGTSPTPGPTQTLPVPSPTQTPIGPQPSQPVQSGSPIGGPIVSCSVIKNDGTVELGPGTVNAPAPGPTTTPAPGPTTVPTPGPTTAPGPGPTPGLAGYTLIWNDEFSGTVLDETKWFLQGPTCSPWYSEAPENVALDGNGNLVLTSTRSAGGTTNGGGIASKCDNTNTRKYDYLYGYIEIRAKLPDTGQIDGIGTSFWITSATRWPPEIDITESGSGVVDSVDPSGTTHAVNALKMTRHCNAADGASCDGSPEYDNGNLVSRQVQSFKYIHDASGNPVDLSKDFHLYGLEWTPTYVSWLLDGVEQFRVTTGVPQENMYVILDVAPGGWASGPVLPNTPFPTSAYVDYVRIYQKS